MRTLRNSSQEVIAEVTAQPKLVLAVPLVITTVADTLLLQEAIDRELEANGTRRVLIDARRANLSTREMSESMWAWVSKSPFFDRIAVVNQSTVLSVAASMKATAIGTKRFKVFQEFAAAARWLLLLPRG